MKYENDDSFWNQIKAGLFGVRKTSDERLFTSRVMAEIRALQPAERPWRAFVRWATPTLVLAMASFTLALSYAFKPMEASAEALLQENQEVELTEAWLASPPDEDQILNSVVNS